MTPQIFISIFVLALCVIFTQVNSEAIYGIGMRIAKDQLLLKDELQARSGGLEESPRVDFNYAIPEPITYIEISSAENVQAEVNFSYYNNLVEGTVAGIESEAGEMKPFKVQIKIYGFNDTILNIDPAYIINRDQNFEGMLEPSNMDREYRNLIAEDFDETPDNNENNEEYDQYKEDGNRVDATTTTSANDIGNEIYENDFESNDKIIEVGVRQAGDDLLFDTYQTSPALTETPTNHSVIFYYIDSDYITYVKFTIFDHHVDENSPDYQPPVAEYSHFSPVSLKAVITDFNTTSILVRMQLYGYKPIEIPADYKFFLSNLRSIEDITDAPLSALHRLKMQLNALPRNLNDVTDEVHIITGATENVTPKKNSSKSQMQSTFLWKSIFSALLLYVIFVARKEL